MFVLSIHLAISIVMRKYSILYTLKFAFSGCSVHGLGIYNFIWKQSIDAVNIDCVPSSKTSIHIMHIKVLQEVHSECSMKSPLMIVGTNVTLDRKPGNLRFCRVQKW
jgi:hypothetical protein